MSDTDGLLTEYIATKRERDLVVERAADLRMKVIEALVSDGHTMAQVADLIGENYGNVRKLASMAGIRVSRDAISAACVIAGRTGARTRRAG